MSSAGSTVDTTGGAPAAGPQTLGVGEILSQAANLYRTQVFGMWTIVALVVIPAQVLIWVIVKASLSSNAYAVNGTIYTSGGTAVPTLAIAVIGFIAAILSIGAMSRLVVDAFTGHPTGWRHSLGFAAERFAPLALLTIVASISIGLGFILLVLPGIYGTVIWSLAVPALMVEGLGPLRAMSRSQSLVQGHWWKAFAVLLVGIVLIIAVSIVVSLLIGGAASSNSVTGVLTLSAVSRAVSALITYPVLAAITAVLYVDLRANKEGVAPGSLHSSHTFGTAVPVAAQPTVAPSPTSEGIAGLPSGNEPSGLS